MSRIGMVLENDYPADLRLEKEAFALRAAGHSVHLLCLEFGDRRDRETVGPIEVTRKRLPRVAYNKLHPTIVRLPFYGALWRRWISRFAREERVDALHVHDLPLAGSALDVGARRNVPVVLDFHENFPAAIAEWGHGSGPLRSYLYDLDRWRGYEREVSRRASRIIVVVDEARRHVLQHGVPEDHLYVVTNTDRKSFGRGVDARDVGEAGPVEFLYIGGFGPHRGLEFAIDGFSRVPPDIGARLRLVGGGRTEPGLRASIGQRGLSDRAVIEPWVPQDDVAREIGKSHVGIVTHRPSDHTNTTIPHKLFLYMAMGRPVIATDCTPIQRVIEDSGCGLVVRYGDTDGLRRAYETMLDAGRRREFGEAARRAVAETYNWETDGQNLARLYESLSLSTPG